MERFHLAAEQRGWIADEENRTLQIASREPPPYSSRLRVLRRRKSDEAKARIVLPACVGAATAQARRLATKWFHPLNFHATMNAAIAMTPLNPASRQR